MATVVAIKHDRENIDLTLKCSFTSELKIDQSISHNGVCLTVVNIDGDTYTVTAMKRPSTAVTSVCSTLATTSISRGRC